MAMPKRFWVRVRCPQDQAPGEYSGKLSVLVQGQARLHLDLAVRVYGFSVPARTPLDLAVTFQPMYYEPNGAGGWQEGGYRFTEWQNAQVGVGRYAGRLLPQLRQPVSQRAA